MPDGKRGAPWRRGAELVNDRGRVRQTCITCHGRYTVRRDQLEADCLFHLCRKCRDQVRKAARKEKTGPA